MNETIIYLLALIGAFHVLRFAWSCVPRFDMNMDGDLLVTWRGRRWLYKRGSGKWEYFGRGW